MKPTLIDTTREQLIAEFETHIPSDIELIVSIYCQGSYEGSAFIVYRHHDVVYEVNASHCSCSGLEGQWEPEVVVAKELLARPEYVDGHYLQQHQQGVNARVRDVLISQLS